MIHQTPMATAPHQEDFAARVNNWLNERATGASLDTDGIACLMRDDQTFIQIEVTPGGTVCHFYAPVAPLPEFDPESALLAALELNRYGRPLGGCWLAWDPDIQMLMLCHNLSMQAADSISFGNTLDNFIAALDAAKLLMSSDEDNFIPAPFDAEQLLSNV